VIVLVSQHVLKKNFKHVLSQQLLLLSNCCFEANQKGGLGRLFCCLRI
jgi:hypothetical protein